MNVRAHPSKQVCQKHLPEAEKCAEEQCLEEFRAAQNCYTLASSNFDFSLLVLRPENDTSVMSMVEEEDCYMNHSTEMDDVSELSIQVDIMEDTKRTSRRVLFADTSSSHLLSTSVNESHASSTVNDRDAVGGILKHEEETINTRFARAEMSLMFSSPLEQDPQCSVSRPLFSVRTKNRRANVSVFDISSINYMPDDDMCENDHQVDNSILASSTALGNLFEICCDKNDENSGGDQAVAAKNGGLSIFIDNTVDDMSNNRHNRNAKLQAAQQVESGDTASFSVFGDLMDEMKIDPVSNQNHTIITPSYSKALCNRVEKVDDPNIKEEKHGDNHCGDTEMFSVFEDNPRTAAKSERRESLTNLYLYDEVHNQNTCHALAEVVLGVNVLDRRSMLLPNGLNQSNPVLGSEITLAEDYFVVHHELGRGAHATVLLCSSKVESEVALKIQSPTGSLAHEFHILGCLEKRLQKRRRSKLQTSSTFPRPINFVAYGNGGLLTMTTASRSGFNLIDLVNVYRTSEGGPVPELIVLFYASRMLLHLETIHCHGCILVSGYVRNCNHLIRQEK